MGTEPTQPGSGASGPERPSGRTGGVLAGAAGYDKDGKYIIDPTQSDKRGTYPGTIYWLGVSIGGRVRGKG